MICYKDRTFCNAIGAGNCTNTDCSRALTPKVMAGARKWWGRMEGEPPIAFADFHSTCPERL